MNKIFRAWYKGDLEDPTLDKPPMFVMKREEGYYCYFEHEDDDSIQYDMETIFCDDSWVVEQWSGVLDKNGVMIFEGDIVQLEAAWGGFVDPVTFCDGCFGTEDGCTVFTFQDVNPKSLEVLGNIYQNKELLEV